MKNRSLKYILLLILTAAIWGVGFPSQDRGGALMGPFTFNAIRFLIGSAALIPLILVRDAKGKNAGKPVSTADHKKLWIAGILCGVALTLAANLQQIGITLGASSAKAGFLTACYILMVPIAGLFFHKKCGWNIWVAVGICLVGLYLLCASGTFSLAMEDLLLLGCAAMFTVQILFIDHFSPQLDPIRLSAIQFLICGLLSLIPAGIFEISKAGLTDWLGLFGQGEAWIYILYSGVFSSGVAYTLQMVAQPRLNPTVASLIMSLESVFASIAGFILLHQALTVPQMVGCGLMFVAIVLAQIIPQKSATGT